MRPFLVYAPSGQIPEGIRQTLAGAGAEALVASTPAEVVAALGRQRPDAILVVPPGRFEDACGLISQLSAERPAPPVFVLAEEHRTVRAPALEALPGHRWQQAVTGLAAGSGDEASALLLSRVQLSTLLSFWEEILARQEDLGERALSELARFLGSSRVSLIRWKAGDSHATVVASSLGGAAVGREVEIARYPELRAAAARTGAVLVEEVERDPLMGEASRYLAGVPVRSLLCQRLPGEGSALYFHAIREAEPFGLSDVALANATVRLLQAIRDVRAPRGTGERAERKRLRAVELLFQGIPEPTALISTSGEILLANPPFLALTGRVHSELTGLDYRALLRTAHPEDEFGPLSESAGSDVTVHRARLVTASGEAIPVDVLTLPASDETYSQAGWSALTLRDLRPDHARRARELVLEKEVAGLSHETDLLQRRAREADAARARFWTAAAHELRTPLAIVQSHLEVVLTDLADQVPAEPATLLRNATEGLRRLERLIADLLDAAVAAGSRAPAGLNDVDLGSLLGALRDELASAAVRRGCTLTVSGPERLPPVRGDQERIERLLFNLVDHALRASPRGEAVTVTAGPCEGRLLVTVTDRGPALAPGRAEELFADVGAARGSAEFGLAVARRLADALGAELSARTRPDGTNVKVVAWPIAGG